jgi:hypothetical protein
MKSLATIVLLCAATIAQNYAPLPDEISKAKTVFFVNDSGTAKFGDACTGS